MSKALYSKPAYYAVTAHEDTTYYTRSGEERYGMKWGIVAGPCDSIEQAKIQGYDAIENEATQDIYKDTRHKNMEVVPRSRLRKYRIRFEPSSNWGGSRQGAGRPCKEKVG